MFGIRDKDIYVRRPEPNRRRLSGREPILMVNARITEQKRKRMHRVGAVVLLVLAVGGLIWVLIIGSQILSRFFFTANPRFTVRHLDVQVSSGSRIPVERLREYAGLREGANLFAVNIAQVCRELEKVPLVDRVQVSRKLPDTLVLRVSERVGLARLGQDDRKYHLAVDRQGHVLGPSARSPNLAALVGVRDQALRPGDQIDDATVKTALNVLDQCDTTRLGQVIKIKTVDVRSSDRLKLVLSQDEEIELGLDQLEWRLGRLARILQEAADAGKVVQYADLTVDKNPPVRYRK